MGQKGPKCWPQASAGDYKGAQPPYQADKRAERALSACSIKIYFEMALTVNRYGMIAGARFATLAQVAGGASASLFPPAFPPSMDEHANSATKRI